jgi:hypothetical protein
MPKVDPMLRRASLLFLITALSWTCVLVQRRPTKEAARSRSVGAIATEMPRAQLTDAPVPHAISQHVARGTTGSVPLTPYGVAVSEQEKRDAVVQETAANAELLAIGSRWSREPRDARWAQAFEATLASALQDAGVDARAIRDLDCKFTLCRVVVDLSALRGGARVGDLARLSTAGCWLQPAPETSSLAVYVARPSA